MKKIILLLMILTAQISYANCFIAFEQDKLLVQEGECEKRYAPESTFKIALALMGFDSGVFIDESNPNWPCNHCNYYINVCKSDHNPHGWMRDSCLWYSQILTLKLGKDKFQDYITKFNYGNKDLSGGITEAWISNSLQISPMEQVKFLQKITQQELPVSKTSYEKSKNIMYILEMSGGWKLYGKTGSGKQHGWFVGYIEKNGRDIQFASHIVDTEKQDTFASFRARNEALNKLWYIINNLEK